MSPGDVVNPPPQVQLLNYPSAIAVVAAVIATSVLLYVSGQFDRTGGVLTISLLITLGMLGACAYCLIFTVPNDDITPGVVGALTLAMGAVVAYWFGHPPRRNGAVPPPETTKEGPDVE